MFGSNMCETHPRAHSSGIDWFHFSLPKDCLHFLETGGVKVFSPISGVCYSLNLRTLISESDARSNLTVNGVGGPLTSVNVVLNIEGRKLFHTARRKYVRFQKEY